MWPNLASHPVSTHLRWWPFLRKLDVELVGQIGLYQNFANHKLYYFSRAFQLGMTNDVFYPNARSASEINAEIEDWWAEQYPVGTDPPFPTPLIGWGDDITALYGWIYWGYESYALDYDISGLSTQSKLQAEITGHVVWTMLSMKVESWAWDLRVIARPVLLRRRRGRPRK